MDLLALLSTIIHLIGVKRQILPFYNHRRTLRYFCHPQIENDSFRVQNELFVRIVRLGFDRTCANRLDSTSDFQNQVPIR